MELTEWRSCAWSQDQGYGTNVETTDGEGRYDGAKVVCLSLGETRGFGGFTEGAFSVMTPSQARALAEELIDAADEAERSNRRSS